MDLIYDAAAKFLVLEQFEYHFVVSRKRKLHTINLNFTDTDFFHIAGLHYLTDVAIPRNRTKTMDEILIKHSITDPVISRSVHYVSKDSKTDVKSRIEELRFLEEYLDTDNFIRIFNRNQKGLSSVIRADYLIESWFKNSSDTVYIFIRRREENPEYYCIVSFFKKNEVAYGGDNVYWMEKVKQSADTQQVLYINPNYKKTLC
ncbi:MAG TPA: hypothetical protein DDY31_10645 [Lachnospiraceae bacterium]|nr:hypothetical protein [Lachnospiraceae bacterium]